jgi:hypothetical protein
VKELKWRIRQFLKVAGPSKAADVVRAIEAHGYKEAETRRALWQLLGSYEVIADGELRLVLPGVHGGVE